ncbi:CAMK family protein kinase [Histomonas meleagridis]|uniref:CAMK family protein kinase n=1 Tax=Histomonas meleagridis TaxID=135588 RepID=UPI003559EC52|nr:CAMK family protein kinase [Histomonas meleagridis]KAH0805874.1 CAMK family protein kinase [Histomonas meleagridis]
MELECRADLAKHQYTLLEEIGSGGFSTVYLISSNRYVDQFFVAKAINLIYCKNKEKYDTVKTEVSALIGIRHPNIISIYDHFRENDIYYIVLEYCPNGSLGDYIKRHGTVPTYNLIKFAKQILEALQFCKNIGIAHRDIKPCNILLDKYNRLKLADFGFAQKLTNRKVTSFVGSLHYLPPEVLHMQSYDPVKADVWSLGITFFAMATGRLPFYGNNPTQLLSNISTHFVVIPDDVDKGFANVIRSMLKIEPKERASYEEILKSPVFRKSNKDTKVVDQRPRFVFPYQSQLKSSISLPDSMNRYSPVVSKKRKILASSAFTFPFVV